MGHKKVDIDLANRTTRIESGPLATKLDISLWRGRVVEQLMEKRGSIDPTSRFYNFAPQKDSLTNDSREYALIDCNDEELEETPEDFDLDEGFPYSDNHPSEREFAFDYQMDVNGIPCRSILKKVLKKAERICKEVKKGGKKAGKGVKKGAKKVVDFVKEHKKEALIVVGIVAVSLGAYAIGAGAFSGAAATPQEPGGANRKKEDENDPDPVDPAAPPPPNDPPNSQNSAPAQQGKIGIMEEFGKALSSQTKAIQPFTPPKGCPAEPPTPYKSAITSFIEQTNGTGNDGSISKRPPIGTMAQFDLQKTLPSRPARSCHFQTDGMKYRWLGIGFINGMNTSCVEHWKHLNHVKKHAGDISIQGVYNHSNSVPVDLLEIFALNYGGIAPITADLLLENWTQFHEENRDNPRVKYLQFTHSMGTIQAKVALEKAPKEIRDRVIIVAIGPAVIIPKDLCFDSFHYVSKNDPVHLGENIVVLSAVGSLNQAWQREAFEKLVADKKRLIILEPHPDAGRIDHDFESPTYEHPISRHTREHLIRNGEY